MAKKLIMEKQKKFEADPEQRFWLNDGRVFSNLKELAASFDKMDDSVWKHHVNKSKNDFANWIEDVFLEKKLGQAIRKAKTVKAAGKLLRSKVEGAKLWAFF